MDNREEWSLPDTYLVVFDDNAVAWFVQASDESEIDGAVSKWMDNDKDSLLRLTFIEGHEFTIMASNIKKWYQSSPDIRDHTREFEEFRKKEEKSSRWSDDL